MQLKAKIKLKKAKQEQEFRIAKLQAALEVADLPSHRVPMPPLGIGPGWHQANDRGALLCGLDSLPHPSRDLSAVGMNLHTLNASA